MIACDDVLVHVGQQARIAARLALGSLVTLPVRRGGVTIRFSVDGEEIGAAETKADGSATVPYTPREEREYRVVATCEHPREKPPFTAEGTIFSRSTRKKALILDIDRTLFASSTLGAIFKRSSAVRPLEGAVEVTRALAHVYDLIVITGRKRYLQGKTRRWFRDKGFPPAPMFFAPPFRPTLSHERFKLTLIRTLRRSWKNISVGIGDRDSDARAYLANGLTAIILRKGRACPPGAITVPDWESIREVLLEQSDTGRKNAGAASLRIR